MITLTDSIEINAKPDEVYEGLVKVFSSQEYFKKWHKDHVKCSWAKGEPFEVGSILYVEEYMHNSLHKMQFLGTKNESNRIIEYKLLFPMSIICPKGSFTINSENGKSIFTATLSFRFSWLFQKFMKSRVEAIIQHMKDESENLKKIVETDL